MFHVEHINYQLKSAQIISREIIFEQIKFPHLLNNVLYILLFNKIKVLITILLQTETTTLHVSRET